MSEENAAPEGVVETVAEAPVEAPVAEVPAEKSPREAKQERDKARAGDLTESLRKSFDKVLKAKSDEPKPVLAKSEVSDTQGQPRAPDGKFAPKTETEASVSVPAAPAVPEPQMPIPSWLRDDAKGEWAKASPTVRGEAMRRVSELENGLQEAKRQFEPLRGYMEQAQAAGTDLPTALNQYTGIEQLLRQNPVKGFETVARNLNIDLRKFAQWYAAQPEKTPAEVQMEQQREMLERQHATLQKQQTDMVEQMITAFRSSPEASRFDELSELIAYLLNTGKAGDLPSAYNMAAEMRPPQAIPVPQTDIKARPASQTGTPAPQTGNPSLYGAPGSNPKPVPAKTVDETIRRNAARLGLSL
jgi:hypothetical protein